MHWSASSFRLQILREMLSVFPSSFPFLSRAHSIQAVVLHRNCSCQSCQDVAPPPTPHGSCHVRYDSVLNLLDLPVTSDTGGHPFLLETSSSLGLQVFPPPWLLSVHLLCWILPSTRWSPPEISSYTSSLTTFTSLEISTSPKGLNTAIYWQVPNLYLSPRPTPKSRLKHPATSPECLLVFLRLHPNAHWASQPQYVQSWALYSLLTTKYPSM